MEVLSVGDRVLVNTCNRTYVGDVAHIIRANRLPTDDELLKYYGLAHLDRHYRTAAKAIKYDRAAIEFKEGYYVVIPVSPKFKGTVQVLLKAGLNRYRVSGCRQGYGMDADKFYNVVDEYDAATMAEAQAAASEDGIFVEQTQLIDREDVT